MKKSKTLAEENKNDKIDGDREPVICILGATGCGKSTFCHLITGSDPRTTTNMFKASKGN